MWECRRWNYVLEIDNKANGLTSYPTSFQDGPDDYLSPKSPYHRKKITPLIDIENVINQMSINYTNEQNKNVIIRPKFIIMQKLKFYLAS